MNELFKPLLKFKFTILFVIYLFLIISFPIHFGGGLIFLLHIVPLVLMLFVIAKTNTYRILDVLFAFMIGINAYFSFVFKSILNLGFLGSILETDAHEASSMLKELWLPILLIAVVSFVLVFGAIRELRELSLSRKVPLLLVGLYSFVFLPFVCYRALYSSGLNIFMDKNPIFVWQRLISTHAPILYGNVAVVISYGNEIYEFQKYRNMERVMPKGIAKEREAKVEKIYLVVGESAWRNHFSAYGYESKTSPFLDRLLQQETSSASIYDGIAPGAITRNAIPLILTFATAHDFSLYYKEKTVLDLANMQGYETIWVSNQSKIDDNDVMGGSSISQIAASATQWHFSDVPFSDDFNLLPKLNEVRVENKKQFIVLHQSGSHISYYNKYDGEDEQALIGEQSDVLAYDRSIHHTDRFLEKVYEVMQKDASSIMYYLSDHGEIIGLGHGSYTHKSEFEVPVFTCNNSTVAVDSIMNKYIEPSTSLFNTSNSIYVLAEIMGFSVDSIIQQQAVENTPMVMYDQMRALNYFDLKE